MAWLYDPEKEKKFDYNLPIHSDDVAHPCYTWQYIIDTYTANYGHEVTKDKLEKHINEILRMIRDDFFDTLELVEDNMLKEIRNKV